MTDRRPSGWVTVGLPFGCILLACGIWYLQMHRLAITRGDAKAAQLQLDTLMEDITSTKRHIQTGKVAALPATREEDTRFLEDLKKAAEDTGITIVKWASHAQPAGTQGAATGAAHPPELQGVTAILSDLEVYGPYESVRAFVLKLESWRRMISMNNMSWHRGNKAGTRLFVTVIRYVYQPGGNPARSTGTGGTQ
ncbi:MAG: hypothetical protein HY248_01300 [Fimbriimonas ginsengisoli]|nr:hypothetical protein [Fimbriimonas ginsengisoli]